MRLRLLILCLGLSASAPTLRGQVVAEEGSLMPIPGPYETLSKAIALSEFKQVLEVSGPFTVFAPSDTAFLKLEGSGSAHLMDPENRGQLKSLVGYHIVAGELTASRILRALSRGSGTALFTTVQGEPLLASLEGSDIVLTDCSGAQARIVHADRTVENLVLHEIDAVVSPESRPR
ncbi:fasciclin domain-containing protein [Robiginitalea marina]|uniref:Fasciclin domain-containing protein n=1 Tax=Robiginitalea marina TaxID=2954105 RepID=A0ABT1AUI0_9FLAO|nr:fasciclin domain-containing protein [Robiginitalea marina]MCO5723694.1 fasciclin domain-containing protein [Robiginitalea marina]